MICVDQQQIWQNSVVRKILLLLVTLCVFTCGSSLARAEEGYVELARNDYGVFSLHLPSVEDRGTYVVGWIKIILRGENKPIDGKKPYNHMVLYAANKESKQLQRIAISIHDKKGEMIIGDNHPLNPMQWEECLPNSFGEMLWNAIIAVNENNAVLH